MKILKLITEGNNPNFNAIEDIIITEETTPEGGKRKVTEIAGPFIQCEVKNRNGRIYPKEIMQRTVEEYVKDRMGNKLRSYGELDHPENVNINLFRVSHLVTHLEWRNTDVYGKAKLLDTEYGRIADTLIKAGGQLGVSSRGLGSLNSPADGEDASIYETRKLRFGEDANIVTDFSLVAIDIVADPSAPEGFVNGILESKQYIIQGGAFTEESVRKSEKAYSKLEESIIKLPKKDRDDFFLKCMTKFLDGLR